MGIAKINGKEFKFEDREYKLDMRVVGSDVVINEQHVYRGDPGEVLIIEAFDRHGRTSNFSNEGTLPAKSPVAIPSGAVESAVQTVKRRIPVNKVQTSAILTDNLIDDMGREARNTQRWVIRSVMRQGLEGVVGALFGKKKKGKR